MQSEIQGVLEKMRGLQEQLDTAFDEAREKFRCTLDDGRVRITDEVREFQQKYRVGSLRYLFHANPGSVLVAPLIYSMAVPLVLLDVSLTIYQHICFRAYGVPRVRRLDYMVNDRHRLGYLNAIEKINCNYCGYGGGVIAYAREILSRTEQYWCPIRHAHRLPGAHERYPRFFPYGDAAGYQAGLQSKREELREIDRPHAPE